MKAEDSPPPKADWLRKWEALRRVKFTGGLNGGAHPTWGPKGARPLHHHHTSAPSPAAFSSSSRAHSSPYPASAPRGQFFFKITPGNHHSQRLHSLWHTPSFPVFHITLSTQLLPYHPQQQPPYYHQLHYHSSVPYHYHTLSLPSSTPHVDTPNRIKSACQRDIVKRRNIYYNKDILRR